MINAIIDGIISAIYDEFNTEQTPTYEIYSEDIKQGLTEPCFSVVAVTNPVELFRDRRYESRNSFCVHYFPSSSTEPRAECLDVRGRLTECLEYIEVDGDKLMGTGMNSTIDDNVLSFVVDYNFFIRKDESDLTNMETITIDVETEE